MTVALGQLALHGLHMWQVNGKDVQEPAVYVVDWPSLAAGASKSVTLTIEGDRDFHLTHITHAQADAGFIPLKVQLSDQNGKNLFIQPTYINAISSINAGQPYLLAMRRLYRRTAPVKVVFAVDA
jgi:hypothetical protein